MGEAMARAMWRLFEPIHAVVYFAPEARAAFEEAGLRGFWRGYFAGRAAPLGPVSAPPVIAGFFGFAPSMVERALPSVWSLADPATVLTTRRDGATAALHRMLPDAGTVVLAADVLAAAAARTDCAGRVLGAAEAAVPMPDSDPYARLWQAATVLREHRGDGHVATLVAAGLDGVESLALRAGVDIPRGMLQPARGWTDEEWDAAAARLTARGWLGPDAAITTAGRERLEWIESTTDAVAARPWAEPLDAAGLAALERVAAACAADFPYPNPIGLPPKAA